MASATRPGARARETSSRTCPSPAGVAACAFQRDRIQTALNWYERALTHDPKLVPAIVGKAECLLAGSDVDGALVTFEQLFTGDPPPDPSDPMVRRAHAVVLAISQRGAGPRPPMPIRPGDPEQGSDADAIEADDTEAEGAPEDE